MTLPFRLLVLAAIVGLALSWHWRRTSVLERRNRELTELHAQRERARQELDDGGRRVRQHAVSRADHAEARRHRAGPHLVDTEHLEGGGHTDDVDDRVDAAHLVEMHLGELATVQLSFDDGDGVYKSE